MIRPQNTSALLLALLLSVPCLASPDAGGPASPQSQHASRMSRHFALLQASRLPQEVADKLLQQAIYDQIPTLAHAAIVRGANIAILHSNPIRLTNWDFLVLDEHFRTLEDKDCTYTAEDWATVFNQRAERYLATKSTLRIIDHLMAKGVNINASSSAGSPLQLSIKTHQAPIIAELLQRGADIKQLGDREEGQLQQILAKQNERKEAVKAKIATIETLAPEQLAEAMGRSALFGGKNATEALSKLLAQGGDINAQWHFNDDPMRNIVFLAATGIGPDVECVKMLMEQGAQFLPKDADGKGVNAQDELGRTPLLIHLSGFNYSGTHHLANPAGVECLLAVGADPNIADKEGRSAIFYAASERRIKELAALIKNNAHVNHRDHSGRTALFSAVEQGNILGTMMLLESLANPFVVDHSGMDILNCQPDMEHKSDFDDDKHKQNVQTCIELVKAYQQNLAPLNQ